MSRLPIISFDDCGYVVFAGKDATGRVIDKAFDGEMFLRTVGERMLNRPDSDLGPVVSLLLREIDLGVFSEAGAVEFMDRLIPIVDAIKKKIRSDKPAATPGSTASPFGPTSTEPTPPDLSAGRSTTTPTS